MALRFLQNFARERARGHQAGYLSQERGVALGCCFRCVRVGSEVINTALELHELPHPWFRDVAPGARMFILLAAAFPLTNAFHKLPITTAQLRIKPLICAAAAAIPPDEEEPSVSRFQSLIANTVSAGRRFRSLLPKPSGFRPTRSVAADGGDMWVRSRATREELKDIVAAATSKGVPEPIMTQFFISRAWLWAQWRRPSSLPSYRARSSTISASAPPRSSFSTHPARRPPGARASCRRSTACIKSG